MFLTLQQSLRIRLREGAQINQPRHLASSSTLPDIGNGALRFAAEQIWGCGLWQCFNLTYCSYVFRQFNMCQEFEGVKKWHNCYGRQATRVNTNCWNQETPTSLQEIASCYLALYFDSKCIEMLCKAFFWTVKVYVSFVWWNANDGQWTPALFFCFFNSTLVTGVGTAM